MRFNIESRTTKEWTKKMNEIARTAIPKAVRATLNDVAFDVKKTTLQSSIKENFPGLKAPQFFKRYSGVNKAQGSNINTMQSLVGLMDLSSPSARRVLENMEVQEAGGIISGGIQYLKNARRGSKLKGYVKTENYYDKNKIISGRSNVGRGRGTNKSKFVARAYRANKEKKPMFLNSMKGNFVVEVVSFKKNKGGKVKIKLKPLMKERENVTIKATHFQSGAATESHRKMDEMYRKNAEYWINKYTR